MSKIIDSLVQTDIDSNEFAGVLLAKFHFSPILRYCNAYQSVYWDESGGGELEYEGLGNLGGVSVIPETNEVAAHGMQFTLSGIPNAMITDIFSDEYQNSPVFLWYALLNKTTFAVTGGQTGPVLIFAGLMDTADYEFGETATITLTATSRLTDWERPRGGRMNESYQRRRVDPTDTGFRYVLPLQSKQIQWAGKTITDPGNDWIGGSSGGSGGSGGGGGGPVDPGGGQR